VHLAWSPAPPDILLARHGQDRGLRLGRPPHPQPPIMPIAAVTRAPWHWQAGGAGPCQPPLSQRGCGRQAPRVRHARLLAARAGAGPRRGQRALAIQEDMAPRTGIAQTHGDRAMVHLACGPAVWAGDASRMATFGQTAGVVEPQSRRRIPQMRDPSTAQRITPGLRGPPGPASQVLKDLGERSTDNFRPWPAGVALGRTPQAPPLGHGVLARLGPFDAGRPAALEIRHVGRAAQDGRDVLGQHRSSPLLHSPHEAFLHSMPGQS